MAERRKLSDISIALIANVALTAVVTLVLLAFAIVSYKAEREQRMNVLQRGLAASTEQMALAVALPTWNFDDSQITAIMRSGLNSVDLDGAVVAATANKRHYIIARQADGTLAVAEKAPGAPGLLVESRPIKIGEQTIGSVTVYATPRFVEEDLRQRRYVLAGVILSLDVALVAFLYLLLWYLILKPLKAVGQYAVSVKAGGSGHQPVQKAFFFGELRTLNESICDMVTLLDRRYLAMRQSEERLSIATHAASIGIWDWDIVTNALVWDQEMYRQYHVEPEQFDGSYEAWTRRVLPADLHAVSEAIGAAMRGGREFAGEFRIAWPDGSIRQIKADSLTFRDDQGRALRMVGVSYDVTEVNNAQQELLRHRNHLEELVGARTRELSVAVDEAKAANRAKSVFLATMSHELRTPLNSVIGFSRMMAGSNSMSDEEKRNLAIIHRSGQHLLTLINDILELSKIEAGRAVLQEEVADLPELMREVMDMVRPRAITGGLYLRLDSVGAAPAVMVDGPKLRQVLLNLLSNAVKFVQQGGVTLELRGGPVIHGRQRLDIAVIDTGIGIAPADQARIFEPFIQAGEGGARDGTGLGLTISREFVRIMGGNISLESALGEGSVFRFSIEAEVAAGAVPASAQADVHSLPLAQRGRRILVVDDNEDGRCLLRGMLTPLGFAVQEADNGLAALACVEREAPELIFMDWRMPGLDGLAVTRRLRANTGLLQPRVVMLTASAFEEERQEALAAGADDFLRKPVEHDKLYQVLEQQLGLNFERRTRAAAPAVPRELQAQDLARLERTERMALRTALQELDLARVESMLDRWRGSEQALVAGIEVMLAQHRYPQLCALIDTLNADQEKDYGQAKPG